jgi:DNA-binding response OmpR family regulator
MKPIAILDDDHLLGEAEHPESLRYVEPEHQRILVVDDDEAIAELLAETLAAEHYRVDVAGSCEDALPLILFNDYDGILLDLVLPDSNGLSLYRQIVRRRPSLAPRVIFVTGALEGGEAGRFIRLVANRVLLKPFDPADAAQAVREVAVPRGGPPGGPRLVQGPVPSR